MKLIAMIWKASVARKILGAMGWDAEKIEAASHARDSSAGLDPPEQGEWQE